MASGIIQTPDRMSDFGNLRSALSPKTMSVPSSSQHMFFVVGNSNAFMGVYIVNCTSSGAVSVTDIKPFTTSTMAFDTSVSNKLTMTSTSTTTVTLISMTLRGDKMYL